MGAIVREIAPALKQAGFRKSRHRFNRTEGDGIVHALAFQMGPFDPPGTAEIPPFRHDLYGKFTVNLGIYVPTMVLEEWAIPKSWVNEYDCQLRKRLGELFTDPPVDTWWSLNQPAAAASDVSAQIRDYALPWFSRFRNEIDVLAAFRRHGAAALGMSPRGPLEIAWMLKEADPPAAVAVLTDYLRSDMSAAHREWLTGLLRANGFGQLVMLS